MSGLVPSFAVAIINLSPLSVAVKVELDPEPVIYLFSPEWSILLAGVIGGTIAYLVGEHSVS